MDNNIISRYNYAKEKYAGLGVDTGKALKKLGNISLSLHCWQLDDVTGFLKTGYGLSDSGLAVTGNLSGKARNGTEIRADYNKVFSLIPGKHRVNLHSIYGETGTGKVDRNEIGIEHFSEWIDWAKYNNTKIDFNCTCFSHPKAVSGYTICSSDKSIRDFWIEHIVRCREISYKIGKELSGYSIHNLWIPDGSKDDTAGRFRKRGLLKESLDEIFSYYYDKCVLLDSVESKLFGIGSESFVAGSFEFYLSYALKNDIMLCLDMGHFHPTESIADKISALYQFSDNIVLHLSRGVRWDSDHIATMNDDLLSLMRELVRAGVLEKTYLATDFFDASLSRIGALVYGAGAVLKCALFALLEPYGLISKYENEGNNFVKFALIEDSKLMPFSDVWNYYCEINNIPVGINLIKEIEKYDKIIISERS
ncbi:MAG: L-rhamnose isomerase [Ignavibacteriae bacterium]|nr:L-rhamnose isomerase [Ignavibacteriota bacterium]